MTTAKGGHPKGYVPSAATLAKIRETKLARSGARTRTGLRGVFKRGPHTWLARIGIGGRHVSLGTYPSAELAGRARQDYLLAPLAGDDAHTPDDGGWPCDGLVQ